MSSRPRPPERLEKRLRLARVRGNWGSIRSACGAGSPFGHSAGSSNEHLATAFWAATASKAASRWNCGFAQRARATKDLDLGMEGNRSSRLRTLSGRFAPGLRFVTFRLKSQTRDMEQADTVRVQVAVEYSKRVPGRRSKLIAGPAKMGLSPPATLTKYTDSCKATPQWVGRRPARME